MCNGCGAFTYPAERYINTVCDCFLPREPDAFLSHVFLLFHFMWRQYHIKFGTLVSKFWCLETALAFPPPGTCTQVCTQVCT